MKVKFLAFTTSIIFLPFLLIAQYTLKGIVKEKSPKETLASATVQIENTFLVTSTDATGNFIFKNLKEGTYRIKVTFVGFETVVEEIMLDADKEVVITMMQKTILTDELVVSATRAGNEKASPVTNLNYQEIENQNMGQDIPYLLNQTPSVTVSSDAGAGVGYTGIRIRGSDPSRVNVTINGVPVNDAESQGTYWVDMPDLISSTDNIQIQRGLGTSTNGAGTFGGSINLKTTGLNKNPYGEVSGSFGSFNTMKNTVKVGSGLINDRFAFDARLSQTSSDGYIDRASSRLKSYYVSGGFFGKHDVLKAIIFSGAEKTYQAWYGVPQDSLKTNRTFNPAGMYFPDTTGIPKYYDNETDNYRQDYYQLHYTHSFSYRRNMNIAFHYTKGKGYYEEFRQSELLSDYGIQPPVVVFIPVPNSDLVRQLWLDNDFYGSTFAYNFTTNHKLSGTFGGAWNKYLGAHYNEVVWAQFAGNSSIRHRYYNENAGKSAFDWYEKLKYDFSSQLHVFMELNWRYINYDFVRDSAGKALDEQSVHHRFSNPKIGMEYDFSAGKNVYVFFGIGNKEPNRDDYVHASPANQPKPESMQNLEIGYKQKNKKYEFGLNAYWMNYKNQLILTGEINDVGAYNRTNVNSSFREGLEAEAGIKFSTKFEWSFNATYSINKIKSFTEYLDQYSNTFTNIDPQAKTDYSNTDIAFSPAMVGGSRFSFIPHKNFACSLLSKYVGEQFLDNTSSSHRKLEAFLVNDLLISWSLHPTWMKEISLSMMINNLLDEHYESNGYTYGYFDYDAKQRYDFNNYFPQAGRNFLGGITLKF